MYQHKAIFSMIANRKHLLLATFFLCFLYSVGQTPNEIVAGQPRVTKAHRPLISADAHLNIKVFDVEQGINSSYINCMLKDKNGLMWFGTDGAGLCKFDGNIYSTYTKEQGLPDDYVGVLYEDKSGNIWIANTKGYVVFDGVKFQKPNNDSIKDFQITSFAEEKEGVMMIGTEVGVYYSNDGALTKEKHPFIKNSSIYNIAVAPDGAVYFATSKGLVIKANGRFEIYKYAQEEELGQLNSIVISKKGDVYLGGYNGIFKVRNREITRFDILKGKEVHKLYVDVQDKLWVSVWDEGVFLYDGKDIELIDEEDGLKNKRIHDFVEDGKGNIWLGTDGAGANLILTRRFVHYSKSYGLSENYIMSISEDLEGNIWCATRGGGVCKYNGTSFTCLNADDGLPDNVIFSVKNDKRGNTFIGSYNKGLSVYNNGKFTNYDKKNGLSNNKIWRLFVDRQDNLFIAYYQKGFSIFRDGKFTHYPEIKGLKSPIRSFAQDKDGIYWLGTEGAGLIKYDGENFTSYSTNNGLCNGIIWDVIVAANGNIWMATGEGVSCFDGKKFINYFEKDGLTTNHTWSILEDRNNNIWVGSEKGINKLIFKSDKKVTIVNYGISEGFTGNDATPNAVMEDNKGNIWWGTSKHLTKYQKQYDFPDTIPPTTQISGIDVFFKKYDWANKKDIPSGVLYSGFNPSFNYPTALQLDHDMNHLTFHFIGIDIPYQHNVLYKFRLDGFENEWNPTTDQTEVTYSNIPPGKYEFQVMSRIGSGGWGVSATYAFEVIPPIWQKTWFIVLSIILIVSIMWALFYLRTLSLRKNQKFLESEIDKRTEQLQVSNVLLQAKNKDITDSINYARNIQDAIIPPEEEFKRILPQSFVLYKPKDIISGDFYWLQKNQNEIFFAAVDCTGHGVPGAMVSLVGHNELNRCLKELGITDTAGILDKLSALVEETFEKSQREVKDGMDISLCKLNSKSNSLQWSGANNPLWIVRNGELLEWKPDKQPIGKFDFRKPFTSHTINLEANDMLYVFTDGYADQFGGDKGKKFKHKQLQDILIANAHLNCDEQKKILDDGFEVWKGDLEQIDDVCMLGIKI